MRAQGEELTGNVSTKHIGNEKAADLLFRTVEDDVPLRQQEDVIEEVVDFRCWLQQRYEHRRLRRRAAPLLYSRTTGGVVRMASTK